MSSSKGKLVKVGYAQQQAEAEMIQGLLSEHGIPSMLRRAAGFDVPDFLAAGPREVLVAEELAEQAREVLEGTPGRRLDRSPAGRGRPSCPARRRAGSGRRPIRGGRAGPGRP